MATITGNDGNNDLKALTATDTLIGLAGDDTYHITSYKNVVTEAPGAGIDTIFFNTAFDFGTKRTYTIGANIENLDASALTTGATITGNAELNVITGGSGNDFLDGGIDNNADALVGGEGSDTYIIHDNLDVITETGAAGIDAIQLAANFSTNSYTLNNTNIEVLDGSLLTKAMTLTGNATTPTTVKGGTGNDSITGGSAKDTLMGGAGNDTYTIHDTVDVITENAGAGTDTVILAGDFNASAASLLSISANVENLDASSLSKDMTLTGNTLLNTITGGTGNDTLDGGADALKDVLIGGDGSDTYVIHDSYDIITENGAAGIDTVQLAANFGAASYTLSNTNIEVLDASSAAKALTLNGNLTSATKIIGNDGKNTITGGSGADTMIGGKGDDTYNINSLSDVFTEYLNEGIDTLKLSGTANSIDLRLYTNVENADGTLLTTKATLVGNSSINVLTGSNQDDTLCGGADGVIDTLIGGKGNDTYVLLDTKDVITDTVGANKLFLDQFFSFNTFDLTKTYTGVALTELDASSVATGMTLTGRATATTITGGTGADIITGGAGNDVLDGWKDSVQDILTGGKGNDTYIIHDNKDKIVEDTLNGGTDTVKLASDFSGTSASLASFDNVENLDGSPISTGMTLTGNTGINTITGGAGADVLDGGADLVKDVLIGGEGGDTYVMHDANIDVITETGTTGIDTVQLAGDFTPTTSTYTLANTAIEALDGRALNRDMTLTGNTATATTIFGGNGNDSLVGGKGLDTLYGGNKNDTLYGGDDSLADVLSGGAGNDTYQLKNTKDIITDTSGANTIKLTSDFTESALSLKETSAYNYTAANITTIDASAVTATTKALTLTGSTGGPTTIKGGAGNDTITGGNLSDTLYGGAGNDVINGGAGDDSLYGGDGDDTLNGGLGSDMLYGGAGNDTYLLNDLNDTFIEYDDAGKDTLGNDTLKLSAALGFTSFTLDPDKYKNIENVDASAYTTSITLRGNNLNNILTGGSASDVIYGGYEADTLIGGRGSDIYFVKSSATQVIEQIDGGYDKVVLDKDFSTNSNNSNSFSLISNVEFLDATEVKNAMTLTGSTASETIIYGTNFSDKITGGSSNDVINGYSGNDSIYGGAGNDTIDGGDGSDYIEGGAGDDTLYGSGDSVTDTLVGGDGSDVYLLKDTKDLIKDTSGGNTVRLNELYTDSGLSLANNAVADDGSKYDYSASQLAMLDAHFVTSHGLTLTGNNTTTTTKTIIPGTDTTPDTTIYTTKGVDTLIYGTNFDDIVNSYSGDDTLYGGYGDATLYGWGNDTLYGGTGTNSLLGGLGDDTYIIDGLATKTSITELTDNPTTGLLYGTDTVKLVANNDAFTNGVDLGLLNKPGSLNGQATYAVSLADYANVEILDGSLITGTDLTLTGNEVKVGNIIIGGAGNDTINGGGSPDSLYGGDGNDTLYGAQSGAEGAVNYLNGGNGDDTYKISVEDEESIKDNAWTATKQPDGSYLVTMPYMKTKIEDSSGIDTIILTGKNSYSKEFQETFTLDMPDNVDNLDAGAISKDLDLFITGNSLDNIIIGGTGYDSISTGEGDDTVYDYKKYFDSNGVWWYTGNDIDVGNGNNTVETGYGDDTIRAGSGDDFVYDFGGDNNINVGDGNNRVYTSEGNDTIITGSGNDYIISGGGDDYIEGGMGINTLIGGAGNDTYILNSNDDTVIEEANAGNDTLKLSSISAFSSVDLADYNNFENIDGELANTSLTLTGNSGNNILTNGTFVNTLIGGDGDDTYMFTGKEILNIIIDTSGNDTIGVHNDMYGRANDLASYSVSLVNYSDIENLDGSLITGIDSNNLTALPNPTNLTLTGNSLRNTIAGGAGNDTIYGGGDANLLIGGKGDDTYILDNKKDTIIEKASGGSDTLQLSAISGYTSFNLVGYANIENIDGSSITSTLTLTGNALDNTLTCGSGLNNTLIGGTGNDTYVINTASDIVTEVLGQGNDTVKLSSISGLTSLDVADYTSIENLDGSLSNLDLTLTGDSANNTLTCGSGSNLLLGGDGNDTYVINAATDVDVVAEFANQGNDTIKISSTSSITSINLADYTSIENVDGSIAKNGLTITGDAFDNKLIGSSQNDTMTGGGGSNTFFFYQGGAKDVITATTSADTVEIDSFGGTTKNDMLFYTDKANNFYIDYTKNGVGSDVAEILANKYDSGTTIRVGSDTIHVNSIVSQLSAATKDLDAAAIANLSTRTEATQVALLTWTHG